MSSMSWFRRPATMRLLLLLAVMAIVILTPMPGFSRSAHLVFAFDAGALCFILSCVPLLRLADPDAIRAHATIEDGGRTSLLVLAALVCLAVLGAVASELIAPDRALIKTVLLILTLAIGWVFGNLVYALHYAHLHYAQTAHAKGELNFPATRFPDYGDFLYFAFTLGMTFQTSDVVIESRALRRVVTLHCLAAFVFNLGVLGFTINILGGLSQ